MRVRQQQQYEKNKKTNENIKKKIYVGIFSGAKVGFIWNSSVVGSVTKETVPKFNWLFLFFNVILQANLEEFENLMIKKN